MEPHEEQKLNALVRAVTELIGPVWPHAPAPMPGVSFNIASGVEWPVLCSERDIVKQGLCAWVDVKEIGSVLSYSPLAFAMVNGAPQRLADTQCSHVFYEDLCAAVQWANYAIKHRRRASFRVLCGGPGQRQAMEKLSALAAAAELAGRVSSREWGEFWFLAVLADLLGRLANITGRAFSRCHPSRGTPHPACPPTATLWPGAQWVGRDCLRCSTRIELIRPSHRGKWLVAADGYLMPLLVMDPRLGTPVKLLRAIRRTQATIQQWSNYCHTIGAPT